MPDISSELNAGAAERTLAPAPLPRLVTLAQLPKVGSAVLWEPLLGNAARQLTLVGQLDLLLRHQNTPNYSQLMQWS